MLKFFITVSFFLVSCFVLADEIRPRWELGAGGGSLSQADYLGSNETSSYTTPFPFVVYRTDKYSIARDGIKGSLIGGDRWGLGISFGGALPVDSTDNIARRGMDDLDTTFEIGPNPHFLLYANDYSKLHFELPVRGAINVSSGGYEGITATPRWVWRSRLGQVKNNLSATVIFANKQYHQRLYSVASHETTAERGEFDARSGYAGTRFSWSVNKRAADYLVGAFVAYTNLNGADNRASDLLNDDKNISYGIVATWIFKRSKSSVTINDKSNNDF